MKNRRRFLFRAATVAVLIAVAAVMMVIGRGHTIYFDNKTATVDGQEYAAYQRAEVFVGEERVARLSKRERGMASCVGQSFAFTVDVTEKKGDEPKHYAFSVSVPYTMDGMVISLPAIIAGLPEEAWRSEFVPQVVQEEAEEEVVTDEFDMDGSEF